VFGAPPEAFDASDESGGAIREEGIVMAGNPVGRDSGDDSSPGGLEGLILSLSASALEALGEGPPREGGAPAPDLGQARHLIDLLELLQVKTQGNLTAGEAALLEQLLFDLRMRYLGKAGPS